MLLTSSLGFLRSASGPYGAEGHHITPFMSNATAVFISVCLFGGCSPQPIESAPGASFDAGPVIASVTPTIRHEFRVENPTNQVVQIQSETHSCTCSQVELDRVSLKPGESIPLKMEIRVPAGYRKEQVVCKVQTDHPRFPEWVYTATFEALPRAMLVPPRLDLGSYSAEELSNHADQDLSAKELTLEIHGPEGEPLPTPGDVEVPGALSVQWIGDPEIDTLRGGIRRTRHRLSVALRELPTVARESVAQLDIPIGDGEMATATVAWRARGALHWVPDRIQFGTLGPNELTKSMTVLIRARDDVPFKLVSAESDSPALRITTTEHAGFPSRDALLHVLEFVVTVPDKDPDEVLFGTARITTDKTGYPEIQIPWAALIPGSGKAPAQSESTPNSVKLLQSKVP